MNLRNNRYKKIAGTILLGALCLVGFVSQSCTEEIDQSNRYTFTGETIVDYLENRSDSFGDFLTILNRAVVGHGGNMKHLLATYGRYTCFAPTDSAIRRYVREQYEKYVADSIAVFVDSTMDIADFHDTGIHSPYFEDLTQEKCSEIAKNHVIEGEAFYTFDLREGAFAKPSMNDRYITYRFVVTDSVNGTVRLKLNDASTCVVQDYEVENGVIQVLDRVLSPSTALGPDLLKSYEDSIFSLFSEALFETGLDKRIRKTSYDMEKTGIKYDTRELRLFQNSNKDNYAKTPETHYIKYTILAIPDTVFRRYGINNKTDLMNMAMKWYGDKYVEGVTQITDTVHPLYRFMAYHIIDRQLQYSGGFVQDGAKVNSYDPDLGNGAAHGFDRYEYYETLLDNGKTIKCTKPYTAPARPNEHLLHHIVLNYGQNRGATCKVDGMRQHINVPVLKVEDFKGIVGLDDGFEFKQEAVNAMIHPINGILIYNDDEMKGNILNERMRINFMGFFPELMNNNIRWSAARGDNWMHYLIPDGYCSRIKFRANGSAMYYLGSENGSKTSYSDYQGDEVITSGPYDFEYRIPHVPAGTYELRLGSCLYALRGIAQTYMDGKVTGIPIDLRWEASSPFVKERFAFKDDDLDLGGDPDLIDADDKARRNRGYMKGPASTFVASGSATLRQSPSAARIILGTFQLTDGDHWIRFKNTKEDNTTEFMHNYLEIVPRSIITDPSKPEDIY